MRRLLLPLVLIAACGGDEGPDPCADAPTYTNDITAIVADHCIGCHDVDLAGAARSGAPAGKNFNTFDDIEPHLMDFADAITSGRMPPMDAPGVTPVTAADRQTVSEWRRCGYAK